MLWTREQKIFCVTTYLETKSFKTVSKLMCELSAIAFLFHTSIITKNKNIILYFYLYLFLVVNNDTAEYTTKTL